MAGIVHLCIFYAIKKANSCFLSSPHTILPFPHKYCYYSKIIATVSLPYKVTVVLLLLHLLLLLLLLSNDNGTRRRMAFGDALETVFVILKKTKRYSVQFVLSFLPAHYPSFPTQVLLL
jgi:hypothetical protein